MFGLINEANFFVVFIALLILAFMLGLIFGILFGRCDNIKSGPKKEEQANDLSENPQSANPDVQNFNQNTNTPQKQNQTPKYSGCRYYYW